MKVVIGADHRGFDMKGVVVEWLRKSGFEVVDVGALDKVSEDDYVDYAVAAVESMEEGDKGILICGTGHGMDIVANRFGNIRSILGFDKQVVVQGRLHEDANVLSMPADWVSNEEAVTMVDFFLTTEFSKDDRHVRRLRKIEEIDE